MLARIQVCQLIHGNLLYGLCDSLIALVHCVACCRTLGETINTGPEDQGPKDWGPHDLAGLYFAFMTEMQLVSMF